MPATPTIMYVILGNRSGLFTHMPSHVTRLKSMAPTNPQLIAPTALTKIASALSFPQVIGTLHGYVLYYQSFSNIHI